MLKELRIVNFAIIHQLELHFEAGLITFTGETGAGKSIILDAIEAVMGGRPDSTLIRSGSMRATIEAVFNIPEKSRDAIHEILAAEELLDDPDVLTMTREIRREGRNVARINGHNVSVSLMRTLGAFLVDIHGQSEHLSLLNVKQHQRLLDRYANSEPALNDYQKTYHKLTTLRRELRSLRKSERETAQKIDLLNFQIQEIETASLQNGEEEELRQERTRLANAEKLASLVQKSLTLLEDGDAEVPAISDLFGNLESAISSLSRIDTDQEKISEQAVLLTEGLRDLAINLHNYQDQLEFNPKRLEEVEIRLDLINNLKRKYGDSIESVLKFLDKARLELDNITHASERIEALEIQKQALFSQLAKEGLKLSALRREASETLGAAVERELDDLSMPQARFKVDMHYRPSPDGLPIDGNQTISFDETGLDQIEFLIAPNPGEGFNPLVKIASGGETSRLMLALKNVLAQADYVATLIFDEIDQGIGGRIGAMVGEKLWQLGRQHQVLCITHLPQLAAFGDQHLCVRKMITEGRTLTQVSELKGEARLNELATMIGGQSQANRTAAQETIKFAHQKAAKLLNS